MIVSTVAVLAGADQSHPLDDDDIVTRTERIMTNTTRLITLVYLLDVVKSTRSIVSR